MLWFAWYYSAGYTYRPLFPANLTRDQLIKLHRFWNLEPETIPANGIDTTIWTLPVDRIMDKMGAVPSDLDDFVHRQPNDPRWKDVDFGGEGDIAGAPILMINSWYDVSIGPNTAMWAYQSQHGKDHMMVIAPTTHCQEGRVETEHTIIGQRDMGDARFDYVGLVQKWYDHWLKGADNGVTNEPKVRAYMMGANQWRSYDAWPPKQAVPTTYYLAADGALTTTRPPKAGADAFTYDPLRPVPSLGGSVCCFSAAFQGGSYDQSTIEQRRDVLVYSTPPLTKAVEITGPVSVTLYLSSDRKDTDLTLKLLDVDPDGKAYNLDESIQRVRWREGWDHPVFMEPGHVYPVSVGPLVTSNQFAAGHRIRIEVSSSNFPRFDRNLNTGGPNASESAALVAHNVIHHGASNPSAIILPVLP
jgi:putative CocE/NonD family hydrolase